VKISKLNDASPMDLLMLALVAFMVGMMTLVAALPALPIEGVPNPTFRVILLIVVSLPSLGLTALWMSAVSVRIRRSRWGYTNLLGAPLVLYWPLLLLRTLFGHFVSS
jgi:hypothetical protein